MVRKVLIIDTSILCVWLGIPGKETCGSDHDRWDQERVANLINKETEAGATLVLPLASIIETGNHIAQSRSKQRRELAQALADKMRMAADEETPWAAFTDQQDLWDPNGLKNLAAEWPNLATRGISLGDATIRSVAERYAKLGYHVEILTGDQGLKSFEPLQPSSLRSRRGRRRRS